MKLLSRASLVIVAALLTVVSVDGKTKTKSDTSQSNSATVKSSPSPTPANSRKSHTEKTQNEAMDLRGKIAQMKFKNGANVVYANTDAKVIADVKDGNVKGWKVTDPQGKTLSTHTKPA